MQLPRFATPRRGLRAASAAAAIASGAILAAAPAQAPAFVYWANYGNGFTRIPGSTGATLGRAELDGSRALPTFLDGADRPCGVAVTPTHLYWANRGETSRPGGGTIGNATIDGRTSINQRAVTGVSSPCGVAVDDERFWWGEQGGSGSIGRARHDGYGGPQAPFFDNAGPVPCGVAVDAEHVYWGNYADDAIGRANVDGSDRQPRFITGANRPCGVAVDAGHVYWANLGDNGAGTTIGRAELDGSHVDHDFVGGAHGPCGVAVQAGWLYWANYGLGGNGSTLGRAALDGTNRVEQGFVVGASGPCGVAVDALGGSAPLTGPLAATTAATDISADGATFNGRIDPNGETAYFRFQYGASPGYGLTTEYQEIDPAAGPQAVSARIPGLTAGIGYHFRLVVVNLRGSSAGLDQSFTALPPPPPRPRTRPTVLGDPIVGKLVKCGEGTWFNETSSFAFQWYRDGRPIAGATSPTYRLATADARTRTTCKVTASGPGGQAEQESDPIATHCEPTSELTCFEIVDAQVNDIDVTQGVQPDRFLYSGALGSTADPDPEPWPRIEQRRRKFRDGTGEVALRAGGKTVVRVYANLNSGPADGISNIPMTLEARTSDGTRLGPTMPLALPKVLPPGDPSTGTRERTDARGAYTFVLPDAWTHRGTLELVAQINPAGIGCDAFCRSRGRFTVTDVPFEVARRIELAPIALTNNHAFPVGEAFTTLSAAQVLTPLDLRPNGFQAMAEVGDLLRATSVTVHTCVLNYCVTDVYHPDDKEFRDVLESDLMDRVEDAADRRHLLRCDFVPIGLLHRNAHGKLPGSMHGEFMARGLFPCAHGYAEVDRPITAVAHELQHAFGRPHAGRDCDGTRDGDDQEGEEWPPDDKGRFDAIGLDTRSGSGGNDAPFAIVAPGVDGRADPMYDLMSYCNLGHEDAAWITPRGWSNLIGWRAPRSAPRRSSRAAPGDGRPLRVSGVRFATGEVAITNVAPSEVAAPAVDPASPYVVEALDAGGAVLSSAPAGSSTARDGSTLIRATVAAPPATTQLRMRGPNDTGSIREISAAPPTVVLRSPRAGQRFAGRDVSVRWTAGDSDPVAGQVLMATVEYSTGDGRGWTRVYRGPAATAAARIPRALLAASRRARVRVTVEDGFHPASATSAAFTVDGVAPTVRIFDRAANVALRADAPLTLLGGAVGAGGKLLGAKALRWYDGRRAIGRGPALSVTGLRPGAHRIRLRATQAKRTGTATVVVRVRAVPPAFLRLDAPRSIGRRARSIRLRVASTVRATLTAAGTRYAVSPRARTLTVAVRPGRGLLSLRLRLSAGRFATRTSLPVRRR